MWMGSSVSQTVTDFTGEHCENLISNSIALDFYMNETLSGFQKKFLECKSPTETKDSDSTEASAMIHGQGFLADVDIKLKTESQDYLDSGENIQSSNTITSLQSKCTPHLSVGITSRSTSLLTEEEKDICKKNHDWKPTQYLTGSQALASSEVSMLKPKQEFPPEAYLQMKTEESQKSLDRNENIQSSNAVIQPKQIIHLQIGLALRPTDLLNEGKKGFCVNYSEQKQSSIEENYVPTEESAVNCGQEFPAEADWKIKAEDFQENLDDNESIQSSNSFTCLQPRTNPYLSLGFTQRPQHLLNEGGKDSHKKHPEWKKNPSTEREDSIPPESSVWKQEQEHPSEVDIQMKADDNLKNLDGSESSQSSDTMPDFPLSHIPPSSVSMDLLNEEGKEAELKDKSVKNQNHLESHTNTQPTDSNMHLPPRHIPHSSTGISPRFTNLPNAGEEEDLQMKLEEHHRNIDGNESIQSSDNVKHIQPRRIRHLLMGLIPRPVNILSRRGKDSHKKCTPHKNPIEIKEFESNAKLEREEIKTFTSVMFEDDQDLCDGSKNNQPLVEATREKRTSNETEDATQSYGCALVATAHDVSTASAVAAMVAAIVVAAAAPTATVAAASAAVAAVVAAAAPAAAAVASAIAAVDALADVAPGAALDSSALPVAAATAATAAAVPAAVAASAPDTAPAVVAVAAAAAAAAVAVTSVAAVSLTAVSAASVAAVVAVAVTTGAGSDAPTVAPAAAAVAAVAAATGPAAAAALVASVAAAAVTPCANPVSAAAPSTVAAATASAAATAVVAHAATLPIAAAAAAAAAAFAVVVPTGANAAAAAVASSDIPIVAPIDVAGAVGADAAATKGRLSLQRKYVEEGKQQSSIEEAEEQDGIKNTISTEKIQVLKPGKDLHDPNALTPVTESCSAEYLGSPLKSTPAFDSYKELLELKEINVQILTEKNKVENELSEVKEENLQLEKKIVRKNERICTLRSIIKEQVEKKRNVICAYNEVVEELRDKEVMIQRRGEQYNRQVTETQELEISLKTRDVELKQLQKEKEQAQRMEDHLQILELENTSLIATVKKQKEEIEHLQRHVQNPHKNLVQSPNFTETAAQKNRDIWNNNTTVITEMENIIKNLKSEVSNVKISKEFSKKELEKYKRFYLEELRNKNFLLHELNRTNESREQSHTELHMKFQQNISSSNTLNTRLVHECSCVEKPDKLENKDFLPGENLVLPSSSTESTDDCMVHYPWTPEDDMRDLSKGLSDLKQSIQLSLETQKKQDEEAGKELAEIGKSFKMTDHRHEIGARGSQGDFETCQLGISTLATVPECLAQATSKPYSEFLKENYTTSTINAMETKIRSLKSTLSKLRVSKALRVLELERYKYLYYEELSIRKSVQYYLNKNNEKTEKSRSKLHMETQHSSPAVNAQSIRPLTECSSTGCFDSIPEPGKSLPLRENQTTSFSNSQPSTSGLEDCLKMMQQVSQ
ncbi:uncharacterized protein LOC116090633 isoform X2 [Mastomys coucha]|uniref:uncharacterized protein LOC116090633 isoform X2 n=1 Tax=Mastomys coucha TaxID=35658 RepID=UPI001261AA2A|nr:uncharacterized protein LOC116090633 isoform X2 [Mastomys coucha]